MTATFKCSRTTKLHTSIISSARTQVSNFRTKFNARTYAKVYNSTSLYNHKDLMNSKTEFFIKLE